MEGLLSASRETKTGSGIAVLKVEGMMNVNTVGGFEDEIRNLIDKKIFRIIINMKDLHYISSAGIGALMGSIRQVRMNHGDIKFIHVSHDIYRIFELLDLQGFFQILKTEQDAVSSFGEPAYGYNT